ncbi:YdeI/OmpD-associated family protein [Algoriphagus aestuarii]|nr:YdeI/OmpD-associated family protein [Algoriphagus aestuarii]
MNTSVENYFLEGCGRCPLGGTPQCKVHSWALELAHLRKIILQTGLQEESKWGVPCYTLNGANILILSAFKNYASISLFKGSLLQDSKKILTKPGENSQAARLIKITDIKEILTHENDIKAYIFEAIEIEKAGLKVDFKKNTDLELVEELQQKLAEDPSFKAAFEALTPGRQRGYNIYFSQAKQSSTRISRIEKSMEKIFEGKGWNDR